MRQDFGIHGAAMAPIAIGGQRVGMEGGQKEPGEPGMQCIIYLVCFMQAMWGVACLCEAEDGAYLNDKNGFLGLVFGLGFILHGQLMGTFLFSDPSGFICNVFCVTRFVLGVGASVVAVLSMMDEEDNIFMLMILYILIGLCTILEVLMLYWYSSMLADIRDKKLRAQAPPPMAMMQQGQPLLVCGPDFGINYMGGVQGFMEPQPMGMPQAAGVGYHPQAQMGFHDAPLYSDLQGPLFAKNLVVDSQALPVQQPTWSKEPELERAPVVVEADKAKKEARPLSKSVSFFARPEAPVDVDDHDA